MNEPTAKPAEEEPPLDPELIRRSTACLREADETFAKEGGTTRHFIRDHWLPILTNHGLKLTLLEEVKPDEDTRTLASVSSRFPDGLPFAGFPPAKETVWLLEKLLLTALENGSNEAGDYVPAGYVTSEDDARRRVQEAGVATGEECGGWPIREGHTLPRLKATKIPRLL